TPRLTARGHILRCVPSRLEVPGRGGAPPLPGRTARGISGPGDPHRRLGGATPEVAVKAVVSLFVVVAACTASPRPAATTSATTVASSTLPRSAAAGPAPCRRAPVTQAPTTTTPGGQAFVEPGAVALSGDGP